VVVGVPREEPRNGFLEEVEAIGGEGAVVLERLEEPPNRVSGVVTGISPLIRKFRK